MSLNKVLILTGSISRTTGGMHSYLYGLCESLFAANIDFELCIVDGNNIDPRFIEFSKHIKSYNFLFHKKFYFSPGMFYNVLNSDYSCIYLHGTWASTSILTILKFFFNKTKYIVVPHGMYCGKLTLNKKIGFLWERILVKYAYFIQALNTAEYDCIKSLFKNAKIKVIYPGLSMSYKHDDDNFIKDLPSSYCLYIGQLHPRKNLINMIRAWNNFKSEHREELTLVIAGFGDDEYSNFVLNEIAMSNNIYFIGPVYGKKKHFLLSNAVCSFLFSHSEGLPTSLLESVYCDTPIICSINCNVLDLFNSLDFEFQIFLSGETNEYSISNLLKIYFNLNTNQKKKYISSLKYDLNKKINWSNTLNLFDNDN